MAEYNGVKFDWFLVEAVKGTAEIMNPAVEIDRETALERLYQASVRTVYSDNPDYLDAAADAVWSNRDVVVMVGRMKNAALN